jgi:hypothetical protein
LQRTGLILLQQVTFKKEFEGFHTLNELQARKNLEVHYTNEEGEITGEKLSPNSRMSTEYIKLELYNLTNINNSRQIKK